MVGVVDFVPNNFEGEEGVAFISPLMIAEPYRNRALATKIIKLIEGNMTKDFLLKTTRTALQTNNPGALRFWHVDDNIRCLIDTDKTVMIFLVKTEQFIKVQVF